MVGAVQRPDLFLVARLLENLVRAGTPMRPTALQLACGINYTQLERYLAYMATRGLVTAEATDDGSRAFAITPKGRDALGFLARTIRQILGEEFGSQRGGNEHLPSQ